MKYNDKQQDKNNINNSNNNTQHIDKSNIKQLNTIYTSKLNIDKTIIRYNTSQYRSKFKNITKPKNVSLQGRLAGEGGPRVHYLSSVGRGGGGAESPLPLHPAGGGRWSIAPSNSTRLSLSERTPKHITKTAVHCNPGAAETNIFDSKIDDNDNNNTHTHIIQNF